MPSVINYTNEVSEQKFNCLSGQFVSRDNQLQNVKPFLGHPVSFLKHYYNYLTGQQFRTVAVKHCSRSANAYQKQEKTHSGPARKKMR